MKELRLSEIWIYPIKSLGGIRVNAAKVLPKGLQLDRRWMLIDETARFMTQRVYPKMALLKLSINHDLLTITFRPAGQAICESIILDTNVHPIGDTIQATIWNDGVETVEVDPVVSKWFSNKLGITCRLVLFPESNPRPVEAEYRLNNDHVSLADGYPFLVIGQSSLNDLNDRLSEQIGIDRFRPNFVFTGGAPYEEDRWKKFNIANIKFAGIRPCGRCNLPTVNQQTAVKGIEPLVTLSQYRKWDNKVLFGQNVLTLETTGSFVNEGDLITVTETMVD